MATQPETALKLQHGNAAQAVDLSEGVKRYEDAAQFWPQYQRGLAYLKLKRGPEAAANSRRYSTIAARMPCQLCICSRTLAARAAILDLDTSKARQAYRDFICALERC
jgi:hypothetical protein